jgi:hypothetical protein
MQKINSQSFDEEELVLLQKKNKDNQYFISLEYQLIDLLMQKGAAIKKILAI